MKFTAAVLSAVALMLVAACGSSTEESLDSDHNAADVMFVQMMIPHHEQAIEMAELIPTRSDSTELVSLGQRVIAAQQPEIDQMQGWLDDWGVDSMGDHSGHGAMGGMMSDDDLDELQALSGTEFDQLWLEMMIEHHEGAIDMAQAVLEDGTSDDVAELATAIITAQEAEITEMKAMLA